MCALFKDRCHTIVELADWLAMYFAPLPALDPEARAQRDAVPAAALESLARRLGVAPWNRPGINAAIKETLAEHRLKMPQLAPAVRVLVCGRAQTPSLDAVLELFPRETVLERLQGAR